MKGKKVKNPLSNPEMIKRVASIFGQEAAKKICTRPVYKYTHLGMGEGRGDERNKMTNQ